MHFPASVHPLPSAAAATPGLWDISPPTQYAVVVGLPTRAPGPTAQPAGTEPCRGQPLTPAPQVGTAAPEDRLVSLPFL